jgi:DNA mismatch repair protein MutL
VSVSGIRILPDILSNKIAAGEVVERPASAVKELMENALDAGGSRILIDVEQGGRTLIRVADNGGGMNRDDALLSVERYATSKIRSDEDLFRISTLGFRGEALPSIAAVSRFSLTTREAASEAGVEISIEGGKLLNAAEVGAPPGTMVTVRELFFNTPARRKFLKSIQTEMAHVGDIVSGMALAWPQVQFRLTHNGRVVKNWPGASEPFERAMEVLGGGLREDLYALEFSSPEAAVTGWVSSPRASRRSANGIFVFVNRRPVRDRLVQHALFQGYAQRLVKGQFPLAVLFISVPFDEVDVNVHPTKSEVRFARAGTVHEAVRRAVAQCLYECDRPQWKPAAYGAVQAREGAVAETRPEFGRRKAEGGILNSEGGERQAEWQRQEAQGRIRAEHGRAGQQNEIWPQQPLSGLRLIGQLNDSYILCEAPDGLVLIDQHAAHERVLYEHLARGAGCDRPASQVLLVPETVELGFREARALEQAAPELREVGIEIEPFGGSTMVVKALPPALSGRDLKPFLSEIAAEALTADHALTPQDALDRVRQIAACHGAIRANQPLSGEQMRRLLAQLEECENLSHCPHGRPTWVRYDLGTIERAFKRIV